MQVSGTIAQELATFGRACLLGAAMMAGYDVIRIFRRLILQGTAWVSVEDIVYWGLFGLAVFLLMYRETDGRIRGYLLGGLAAGSFLYYALLGRWLVRWLGKWILVGKKRLKKACKAVTIKIKERFGKKE